MSSAQKVYTAIGLMSGTSLDGVDAALIETDGRDIIRPLSFLTKQYPEPLREGLRACFGKEELDSAGREAEAEMTLFHADTIRELLALNPDAKPELIGFHGQTILHEPEARRTVQIGDAELLAQETGLDVIYDFRSDDVAAGGQGAPLVPVYHQALVKIAGLDLPVAILNIGGVANITYIGADAIAFDTGPGNALMDDMIRIRTGEPFDRNGHKAARGLADQKVIARWMEHPHFSRTLPKSLDRDAWDVAHDLADLSLQDALATLMAFTVRSIAAGFEQLPEAPKACYVCGGGRHNETLMVALQMSLPCDVRSIDTLGWNGDATEAQCFGYLAVRSLLKLPISFPGTSGAPKPMTGGKLQKA